MYIIFDTLIHEVIFYTIGRVKMCSLFARIFCDLFVFVLSLFFYFYEINLPTRSEEDWSSVLFKQTRIGWEQGDFTHATLF